MASQCTTPAASPSSAVEGAVLWSLLRFSLINAPRFLAPDDFVWVGTELTSGLRRRWGECPPRMSFWRGPPASRNVGLLQKATRGWRRNIIRGFVGVRTVLPRARTALRAVRRLRHPCFCEPAVTDWSQGHPHKFTLKQNIGQSRSFQTVSQVSVSETIPHSRDPEALLR